MTLSLDDVRNKRFRMARKSGYEVLEVDEFVDQVETAFEQLVGENANLRQQIEALSAAPRGDATPDGAGDAGAETQPQTIVVTTGKEASTAVVRLVEMSTEQAERLLAEATADAARIRAEAGSSAEQVAADARTRAEQLEAEARTNADQVTSEALSRAEGLDRDLDTKRVEMFGGLERERDELSTSVRRLREFEAMYRANLTSQLHEQLAALESLHAEPDDAPELSTPVEPSAETASDPAAGDGDEGGGSSDRDEQRHDATGGTSGDTASDTPRLDALLGEQR